MSDPKTVACPYCGAQPGEHCRTMNGNLTGRQWGFRVNHYRREVAAKKSDTPHKFGPDGCEHCGR